MIIRVITLVSQICDYAFEEPPDDVFGNLFPPLPRHTDDELKAQNWDRSLIEGFRLLTSVTMLHEASP